MENIWHIFIRSFSEYGSYLWNEITFQYTYKPIWQNYFYLLIGVSLFFFGIELLSPWRKGQKRFRKDFWLDGFYMFFNFFLFYLIIFSAASNVVVELFSDFLGLFGIRNLVAINVQAMPIWVHLLIGFFVRDFIQWWVHRLLHRSPTLWEYHKVHHSVQEMGFAAHLRYHWMENVVYRTLEYIPLAMIGVGLNDFFVIHAFTLIVGHYNHANIRVAEWVKGLGFGLLIGMFIAFVATTSKAGGVFLILAICSLLGILSERYIKYIFNSPEMHIWHHAKDLPEDRKFGVNFALTLSCWDYLFGTNYIPFDGRDIDLGFPEVESFPQSFIGQNSHGFRSKEP